MSDKMQRYIQRVIDAKDWDSISLAHEIRLVLTEQDRDTRHACAEAVLAIDTDAKIIITLAHQACMNARAL